MKKVLKKIAAVFCAAVMIGSLAACNETVINAYDIAVKNGFQGTEQEWLASLRGEDGKDGQDLTAISLYQAAQENGYEGSYLDFCRDVLKVEVSQNNNVDIIARNVTSVVSINCGFLKKVYDLWGMPHKQAYSSAGSGVIIDLDQEKGDALIVTNYHVIYDVNSLETNKISPAIWLYSYGSLMGGFAYNNNQFYDSYGEGVQATYVGGAMGYDIALLRVENSDYIKNGVLSEAIIGDSDQIRMGEKVYAIGNPSDEGIAVTEGIVSVESEFITMETSDGQSEVDFRVIRTDAAINGGNSGGALFNASGELVGIVNAKNIESQVDNVGYALPATKVKNLCNNILYSDKNYGDDGAHVATLGIITQITDTETYFDTHGALRVREEITVAQIATSGAAKGLLKVGDAIKEIKIGNGEWFEVTKQYQIPDRLLLAKLGDVVQIKRIDAEGNEGIVEVPFTNSNYFTVYK